MTTAKYTGTHDFTGATVTGISGGSGSAANADIQLFTASGTWTKPAGGRVGGRPGRRWRWRIWASRRGQGGAAGGTYGAGGGGGSASVNGQPSGAGGAGASGAVLVITYF